MARKSWGLRKIGIVGIPKQERDDEQQRQWPPKFRLTRRHFGPHSHSPRSQPQLRRMFVYYALLLTLTPTASLAANPARMSSSWVRLKSPVNRFVTCHKKIQRVEMFGWLYANEPLFYQASKRERQHAKQVQESRKSAKVWSSNRFFWERFPAKITTQVSRQEESGSISPNDATVELYEGEIHLDQHYQASKSRSNRGKIWALSWLEYNLMESLTRLTL